MEAHVKGSVGLAAAATDKGINTVLYLRRGLHQPGRWKIKKEWKKTEFGQKIAKNSRKMRRKKRNVLKEGVRKEKI